MEGEDTEEREREATELVGEGRLELLEEEE